MAEASTYQQPSVEEEISSIKDEHSIDKYHILVMGATGAGKSTFINYVTGRQDADVGHQLNSATSEIKGHRFMIDGRDGIIWDTPGFDDTYMSDLDVFTKVAEYFKTSFAEKSRLLGMIYLHDISRNKITRSQMSTITVFEELCGKHALRNVIVATTMWDKDPEAAEGRVKELLEKYMARWIRGGATHIKHAGTKDSAQNIVRMILGNEVVMVQLQQEIMVEKKELGNTKAGQKIQAELGDVLVKKEKDIATIQSLLNKAEQSHQKERDENQRSQEELRRFQEEYERDRHEAQEEKDRLQKEKEGLQSQIDALKKAHPAWETVQKIGIELVNRGAEAAIAYGKRRSATDIYPVHAYHDNGSESMANIIKTETPSSKQNSPEAPEGRTHKMSFYEAMTTPMSDNAAYQDMKRWEESIG